MHGVPSAPASPSAAACMPEGDMGAASNAWHSHQMNPPLLRVCPPPGACCRPPGFWPSAPAVAPPRRLFFVLNLFLQLLCNPGSTSIQSRKAILRQVGTWAVGEQVTNRSRQGSSHTVNATMMHQGMCRMLCPVLLCGGRGQVETSWSTGHTTGPSNQRLRESTYNIRPPRRRRRVGWLSAALRGMRHRRVCTCRRPTPSGELAR